MQSTYIIIVKSNFWKQYLLKLFYRKYNYGKNVITLINRCFGYLEKCVQFSLICLLIIYIIIISR